MWKRSNLRRGKLTLAFLALIVVGLYGLAWATYDRHNHSDCRHYGTIITHPNVTATGTHYLRAQTSDDGCVMAYVDDAYGHVLGPIQPCSGKCLTTQGTLNQGTYYTFTSLCSGSSGWAVVATSLWNDPCYGDNPGGE